MADAFASAAPRASSPFERRRRWQNAHAMYEQSVAIWADMSRLGMLTSSDDEEAAVVARSLTTATSALKGLPATAAVPAPSTH
jgi:hypothetical protein